MMMQMIKTAQRAAMRAALAAAVCLLTAGTAQAAKIADALFTNTVQICSAANNPYFGAGLTENVAALNLTYYINTGITPSSNQEGNSGAYAGGTLNGIGWHNILLGGSYGTATGVTVSNALTGVTMDYSLTIRGNRLMSKAVITGADSNVAYNVSAANYYYNGGDTTTITLHGLAPNNAVYVQLIGGEHGWNTTPNVSLNGGTAVAWTSISTTHGERSAPNGNPALLGITGTTDASGNLLITMTGSSYYGLAAVTVAQLIPGSTTTTLASSPNPSLVGDAVTFTATIAPASGAAVPTGSVQFMTNGVALGDPVTVETGTSPTGTASIATSELPKGLHTVTAVFTGTGDFKSSSGTLTGGQTVNSPTDIVTTTTVASSANPSTVGNSVTFTAMIAPASGAAVPTGSVQFMTNDVALGDPVTVETGTSPTGTASYATSALPVGVYTVTAKYTPDSGFGDSLGTLSPNQTVNKAAPTTSLARQSGTVTPSAYGDTLVFNVTVVNGFTPAGTVTLKDGGSGGTTIGSGTLSGGACAITNTTLALGTHTNIVAVYPGDGNNNPSTSSALDPAQVVNPGAPAKLVFTTQPSGGQPGAALVPQPVVTLQDAFGNTANSSAAITLAITAGTPTNGGPGTLSGTKTVSAVSGVATFTNLSIDVAGAGYKLTATSEGLASTNSTSFKVEANLITNGSFEVGKYIADSSTQVTPPYANGYTSVSLPGTDLPGWNGTFSSWYCRAPGIGTGMGAAQDGERAVNLTGATAPLFQTFAVEAGAVYTVSYYEKIRGGGTMDATLSVAAGTVTGAAGTPVAVSTGPSTSIVQTTAVNANWTLHSFTFTPDTPTMATLTFRIPVSGDGVFLDNVSVTTPYKRPLGTLILLF
ncbi:MAG: Ig-like domain repeat protein [bacterium]